MTTVQLRSWSHSRSEAMLCPFYFKSHWLDGLPQLTSDRAKVGKVIHKGIEKYLMHLQTNNYESDYEHWANVCARDAVVAAGGSLSVEVAGLTKDFAANFHFDPQRIYEVEWKLAANIFTGEVVPFEPVLDENGEEVYHEDAEADEEGIYRGVIDLTEIEGTTVYLTDWKTGYVALSKEEAKADKQLRRYAWLVSLHLPGVTKFVLRLEYLRLGFSVPVEFELEELETVRAEIEAEWLDAQRRVRENDWPAQPSKNCTYCKLRCPLEGTAAEPERIQSIEDAIALGERIAQHEQFVDRANFFLEQFTREHGEVAAGGRHFGFRASSSKEYPDSMTFDIIRAARELGVEEDKLMRPQTPAKLRDVVMRNPALKERFGEPEVVWGEMRYGVRKRA